MGNCVSSHKNTDMKLTLQIQSPNNNMDNTQHIPAAGAGHSFLPQPSAMGHVDSFRDLSSKEDIFFDSQPWLDSDCEDYFSVNGDLTPSCGSSPVHQKGSKEAPQLYKIPHMDSECDPIPQPSPTDMTKQLIELFGESFHDDPADGNQNSQGQKEAKPTIMYCLPKSTGRSPYELEPNSIRISEMTPYKGSHPRKQNSAQTAQCCIPGFMRNLTFSERKRG